MVLFGLALLSEFMGPYLVIALVDLMKVDELWSLFGYDVMNSYTCLLIL